MVEYIKNLIALYSHRLRGLIEKHEANLKKYEAVIKQMLITPLTNEEYKKRHRLLLQQERAITKEDIPLTNEIDEVMCYLDALYECLEFIQNFTEGNIGRVPKKFRGVFSVKNGNLVLSRIGLISYCQGKYAEFVKIMRMSDEKYAKYVSGQHIFMGTEEDILNISSSSYVDESKKDELDDDNICI